MMNDSGRCGLEAPVGVVVNCCSKSAKLFVKFVFKVLHGLVEVSFGN